MRPGGEGRSRHANPGSTVHDEEHPSPSTLFPSSHCSSTPAPLLTAPSPHLREQSIHGLAWIHALPVVHIAALRALYLDSHAYGGPGPSDFTTYAPVRTLQLPGMQHPCFRTRTERCIAALARPANIFSRAHGLFRQAPRRQGGARCRSARAKTPARPRSGRTLRRPCNARPQTQSRAQGTPHVDSRRPRGASTACTTSQPCRKSRSSGRPHRTRCGAPTARAARCCPGRARLRRGLGMRASSRARRRALRCQTSGAAARALPEPPARQRRGQFMYTAERRGEGRLGEPIMFRAPAQGLCRSVLRGR